jgi:hypothetical protein
MHMFVLSSVVSVPPALTYLCCLSDRHRQERSDMDLDAGEILRLAARRRRL